MGNAVCSNDPEVRAQSRTNKRIEDSLRGWAKDDRRLVKLLLLGAGESGKSTIVKQMKIIHSTGFSEEDCLGFKRSLFMNLLESMCAIVDNMGLMGIDFENPSLEERSRNGLFYASVPASGDLDQHTLQLLERLWKDRGVQRCFEQSSAFHISDGAGYLFNHLKQYMVPDFIPTAKDVLHIRVRTHGIIETAFRYRNSDFQLFDVGGQRSERRKWIHCFDNVTAIIFCASLSGYDTTCVEDGVTIRLHESLELFENVCNSRFLQASSLILFLNKTDLLRKKVFTSPLTVCFPEYTGQQTFEEVSRYIEKQFLKHNRKREPERIYVHKTCATDTSIVEKVFRIAADTILRENLERIMS